jgi:thiaminase
MVVCVSSWRRLAAARRRSRFAELSTIFTTATRLEANFWQMGLNAVAERPA